MINADIVPVIAAGNEGFSSVTIGSPGTSFAALTVGAASSAQHEQIFRAQFSAPCSTAPLASVLACAKAWRPDMNVQISEFSSRGPTHDGRVDPDVVANGSFNFSQGSGATAGDGQFRQRDVVLDADGLRHCRRAPAGGADGDRTPGAQRDHHVRRSPRVCRRRT